MRLSNSAKRLKGQSMFQLLDRAKELESIGAKLIHFEIGDPNFDTPLVIREAAVEALMNNFTHYTSSAGLLELRVEIMNFYRDFFGAKILAENVVIAPGCNPLIHGLIECLVNKGENVLITDPSFPTYSSVLDFLDITTNLVPLKEENSFCPDFNDIVNAVNEKTRLIILNSPNNPTGSVMDPNEILRIVKFAKEKDIVVLCDEIYNLLNYTPIPFSASEHIKEFDNVVVISGFSKCFAMSGWRIGYLIAQEELCKKVALLLQTTVSCTNSFVQKACCSALTKAHGELHQMKHEYMRRRNYIFERINSIPGMKCEMPMGAFYVFPNVSGTGMDGEEFCERALVHGSVVLPGNSFGPSSKNNVRFCFTRPIDEIREGLDRIERMVRA